MKIKLEIQYKYLQEKNCQRENVIMRQYISYRFIHDIFTLLILLFLPLKDCFTIRMCDLISASEDTSAIYCKL